MILAAFIALEFALVALAGSRARSRDIIGAGVFANTTLIVMYAPLLIEAGGGYVINIGSVFYSGLVACQIVVLERYGPLVARNALPAVLWCLAVLIVACSLVNYIPVVAGNEVYSDLAKAFSKFEVNNAIGRFSAFLVSQMIMIASYTAIRERVGQRLAVVLAMVLCQFVDTPIGVLIVFRGINAVPNLTEFIIVLFLARVGIGLILTPAIFLALWLADRAQAVGGGQSPGLYPARYASTNRR